MRFLAGLFSIFLATCLLAQNELPKDPGESLDIEPPVLTDESPSRVFAQEIPRELEDGLTFGITKVTATNSPDTNAEKNMKLKIGVKVRSNTVIDPTKVKIQVFFYDAMGDKKVVLTDAHVSYAWLTPHHDWRGPNPEVLAVTYSRPRKKVTLWNKTTKEVSGRSANRKYLGYIVRVYYNDQRQAVRADPAELLNLFPPPLTLPSK